MCQESGQGTSLAEGGTVDGVYRRPEPEDQREERGQHKRKCPGDLEPSSCSTSQLMIFAILLLHLRGVIG